MPKVIVETAASVNTGLRKRPQRTRQILVEHAAPRGREIYTEPGLHARDFVSIIEFALEGRSAVIASDRPARSRQVSGGPIVLRITAPSFKTSTGSRASRVRSCLSSFLIYFASRYCSQREIARKTRPGYLRTVGRPLPSGWRRQQRTPMDASWQRGTLSHLHMTRASNVRRSREARRQGFGS
jgi:hypothetical protein